MIISGSVTEKIAFFAYDFIEDGFGEGHYDFYQLVIVDPFLFCFHLQKLLCLFLVQAHQRLRVYLIRESYPTV